MGSAPLLLKNRRKTAYDYLLLACVRRAIAAAVLSATEINRTGTCYTCVRVTRGKGNFFVVFYRLNR